MMVVGGCAGCEGCVIVVVVGPGNPSTLARDPGNPNKPTVAVPQAHGQVRPMHEVSGDCVPPHGTLAPLRHVVRHGAPQMILVHDMVHPMILVVHDAVLAGWCVWWARLG